MMKILWVAWREFCATALTKGFIFGVVMTPLLILVVGGAAAYMKGIGSPRIVGEVAVIDRSGEVGERLAHRFSKEGVAEEAARDGEMVKKELEEKTSGLGLDDEKKKMVTGAVDSAIAEAATERASLSVVLLPADADVEKEKAPIAEAKIKTSRDSDAMSEAGRVALVVISPETVRGDAAGKFPPFQAFFVEKLDFEVQSKIERRVADSVVDARLTHDPRLLAAGMSPEEVRRLLARPGAESREVGKEGEDRKSFGAMKFLVPMAFMILMMVSVFTSGQYLLTSTVEEKGNRVMELLLSAVSPMQLMAGKVLGQMIVGLVIMVLYTGLGVASLVAFVRATGLIDMSQIALLFVYFAIAFFLVASMMAAIGAAVNEMREAQALMSPVMILMMIPWLTWFVIQRDPNGIPAVVLSFIPGPSPFVMVIRLAGSEPIPTWQIPATILLGVVSVIGMFWAAGKVFRIGALMYGKPPNIRTLIRWVRMA